MRGLEAIESAGRLAHCVFEPLQTRFEIRQVARHFVLPTAISAQEPRAVEDRSDRGETTADDEERDEVPEVDTHENTSGQRDWSMVIE
jgi:hypothetical protein